MKTHVLTPSDRISYCKYVRCIAIGSLAVCYVEDRLAQRGVKVAPIGSDSFHGNTDPA